MEIEIKNDRYSRLELITWWDQDILRKARILIAGCGALGNEIVKNLVMLGVGNICVIDMDRVEKSNLTRSILFRSEDEGKSKAETICRRATEINPDINIKYFDGNIFSLGIGEFGKFDLIIGGLDNREARLFINQSCWKIGKPWIDGAIEILNGVARMFIPKETACYECTMSETDYKILNKRKSCMLLGIDEIAGGKIPTTPTSASIIAGIEVQEAIKYLHGRNDLILLKGKGFIFSGAINDSYIVEYQFNENCPSHYSFDNINKIDKKFDQATLNDVIEFGKEYFLSDEFMIEFNNEIVYEVVNEDTGQSTEHFANMNLMSVKDVKLNDGNLLKLKSFHNLKSKSGLAQKFLQRKLIEMRIPFNDIVVLRKNEDEVQVSFDAIEIFR